MATNHRTVLQIRIVSHLLVQLEGTILAGLIIRAVHENEGLRRSPHGIAPKVCSNEIGYLLTQ
jgi:hypothetical protein